MPLTPADVRRYARHLALPNVGREGQERLQGASVLLVGLGGLGSPASLYLAAAGIGRLGLVDFDRVDESNLQRQVLYGTQAIGQRKAWAAVERLHDINPSVKLESHAERLTAKNALQRFAAYDVVVDGTDQFATRYLINDACVILGKPNVHGSVHRFEGQVSVFSAHGGPCYRCLFPEPPSPGTVPSCEEGGVLGVLPGIIGSMQAVEVIKLILGIGEPLMGRLLHVNALSMHMHTTSFSREASCRMCGTNGARVLLDDYDAFCGTAASPERSTEDVTITARELKTRMSAGWDPWLLDVREPWEFAEARLEHATLIPLNELAQRTNDVPRDVDVVVYCHHGIRSAHAAALLRMAGWTRVVHLGDGIDGWSLDVDPSVPRY